MSHTASPAIAHPSAPNAPILPGAYPTDEQILGISEDAAFNADAASGDDRVAPPSLAANSNSQNAGTEAGATNSAALPAALPMDAPEWLARASAAAPDAAPQLAALWQRSSALDTFDRAYYGADASAQQALVAQLYADDPAALRTMVAAAQQILDGSRVAPPSPAANSHSQKAGTEAGATIANAGALRNANAHQNANASHALNFDPAAYAQFEQSTNDAVISDVNRAIERALDRALPSNIADGARRRIAGDTLAEVHAALQGDRDLSAQVAALISGTPPNTVIPRRFAAEGYPDARPASGVSVHRGTPRLDSATRDAVARLIVTRARGVIPEAARRVIGEWTGSVLASHRERSAKTQAASARVDVTGSAMNSPAPRRAVAPRDINYRATSDEDILSW